MDGKLLTYAECVLGSEVVAMNGVDQKIIRYGDQPDECKDQNCPCRYALQEQHFAATFREIRKVFFYL